MGMCVCGSRILDYIYLFSVCFYPILHMWWFCSVVGTVRTSFYLRVVFGVQYSAFVNGDWKVIAAAGDETMMFGFHPLVGAVRKYVHHGLRLLRCESLAKFDESVRQSFQKRYFSCEWRPRHAGTWYTPKRQTNSVFWPSELILQFLPPE